MMVINTKSPKKRAGKFIITLIMVILSVTCIFPLWYTFCVSVSGKSAVDAGLVTLYPIKFSLFNYREIMGDSAFWNSFLISVKRVLIGTPILVFTIILIAYPISKTTKEFHARNVISWLLVFCMMFASGLIPWYVFMTKYKMINNFWGLVFSTGLPVYYVMLAMNSFRSLPIELEEAAKVDGANPWQCLFLITVPCSKPIIATITLFSGVEYWNEYYNGMLLSTSEKYYPLMTYIKSLTVQMNTSTNLTTEQMQRLASLSNDGLNSAKVFIALIPMLIVYPFLQRYFVKGITVGAVKG